MTNVNISEKAWKTVKSHSQPGESFAKTLDRILRDWNSRGNIIGELDEELSKEES